MSKYERMLAVNRQASGEKVDRAKQAIVQLLETQERISVTKLISMTGLSKGFFYKNPDVRKMLDSAMEKQAGMPNPRRSVLDLAMNREIELLQRQLAAIRRENEGLKADNLKLKKALEKKNASLIRNL